MRIKYMFKITYYEYDIIMRIYHIKNNKDDGEYISWYKNKQMWIDCYFINGILEGEYKSWSSNGQLFKHSYYKDGVEF